MFRTEAPLVEATPTEGSGRPISISGARPDQNSYRLDGISINDYANGAPGSVLGDNLGIDAVEQVSVLGSNYPSEYGRTSGGVINAVTRSGTNNFHGSLYEFLRNSALDARNYFDGPIPPFKRNQFGGSAGVPIQKDRTFIFGDYEGLRQSLGVTTVDTVPSAGGAQRTTLNGNGKSRSFGSAVSCGLLPFAQRTVAGWWRHRNLHFAGQQVTNENYFTFRVDRKFSEKDSLYGTYMRDSSKTVQPDAFHELLSNIVSSRQVVTLHEQHIFSPTLLNCGAIRFQPRRGDHRRSIESIEPPYARSFIRIRTRRICGRCSGRAWRNRLFGRSHRQGPFPPADLFFGIPFREATTHSLPEGIHALKFGALVERMQDNEMSFGNINGIFRFDSLVNFLTNQPHVFQGTRTIPLPEDGLRQTLFGAYVQDDVRLQKNLTFNAGLRYEMVTVPTEAHNRISVLPTLTAAQPQVGAPLFLNPTLRNFEPRVGVAWNPRGGKTLVRGGFGIFDVLAVAVRIYALLSARGAVRASGIRRCSSAGLVSHRRVSTIQHRSRLRLPPIMRSTIPSAIT